MYQFSYAEVLDETPKGALWGYLIEDLARPDNDLPQKLRADLISIGLWMMREAEQIRLEASSNFKGLIDVSTAIRDGLE
jgi:flagellar biosynthesis activator protein FlaF